MTRKKSYINNIKNGCIWGIVVAILIATTALQQQPPKKANQKIVELKQARLLFKTKDSDTKVLKDSVILYHKGAYMYCDSANLYEVTNSFEAFSNVRMEQGDSIFVYGDYLYYDGNTQMAHLRNNIRMEDKKVTLFTDSLDFDRVANLGYYFEGGMLVDETNELTSYWGQYNTTNKDALFLDSVKLVNEDFTIHSDSMKYNTDSKIAKIVGPSKIVSDSGYIETTNGIYNTITDDAKLLNRSKIFNKKKTKVLVGDTILYNRALGNGEVFGNMALDDFEKKLILHGNYGKYNEKTERGMATDSAYAVEYSQKDSLFFHGDTLQLLPDSIYKNVKAYHNVRFFRKDMQGICDSLSYIQKDSVIHLIGNPVLWSQENQILGEKINIYLNDSTIDRAHVKEYGLAIQDRLLPDQYNQLSGRDMKAKFVDGELRNVLVEGNAESIYYMVEADSTIVGLNKTESSFLSMDLQNGKMEKLKIWTSPKANLTPLKEITADEAKLKGFMWLNYLRPKDKNDIFRSNKKDATDSNVQTPKRFSRDEMEQ